MEQTFGSRLKEARLAAGLSVETLASRLGVHRNSVAGYEADQSQPNIAILPALAQSGIDWTYVSLGRPERELVADKFDWELLRAISDELKKYLQKEQRTLTDAQTFAVARNVYLQAVLRKAPTETKFNFDTLVTLIAA